ncbi:MAG: EpsG family protein [Glaciimonas sp.]|nr:EpsG family protein [Glaciimonas sp.]
MVIYFLILLVPLTMGLLHPLKPQKSYAGFWLYFLALLVFCGFRFEVGADWTGYQFIYDGYLNMGFDEALQISEPGFFVVNKVSDWLGFGYAGVIFISSLIFLYGCFSYARKTSNPWLAVAAVMPYLIFIISLSGIRQACAIGIGFYLFTHWERSSLVEKVAVIALAVSFHNTAGVLLLFVIFTIKSSAFLRISLAIAVAVFLAYGLDRTDSFEKYKSVYVDENLISGGAFFHVLLIAFPSALYLLFRKELSKGSLANSNVFLASILTLGAMPFLAVSSTGIDRLTLYFSFVQMLVYPAILRAGVVSRSMIRLGLTVLVMAIFFVYFLYGAHAYTYLPYKNIFFE